MSSAHHEARSEWHEWLVHLHRKARGILPTAEKESGFLLPTSRNFFALARIPDRFPHTLAISRSPIVAMAQLHVA